MIAQLINQQSDDSRLFESSGTFTVPPLVKTVVLTGCAAGGGGGGPATDGTPGGGGGGGEGIFKRDLAVTPGAVITVTIGAGGAGGNTGQNGAAGGNTTFGLFTLAAGGGGAKGTVGGFGAAGGAAGNAAVGMSTGGIPGASLPPVPPNAFVPAWPGSSALFPAVDRTAELSFDAGTDGWRGEGGYGSTYSTPGGNGGDGWMLVEW